MVDNAQVGLLERQQQIEALIAYAADAARSQGRFVLVAGEAGVGKSSLVEAAETAIRTRARDARWCWGRADGQFTPRPLGPMAEIAEQLGGAVAGAFRANATRAQLFATLLESLRTGTSLTVLAIEDLHWADEATLDALRYLARRLRDLPTLVIATYRDDGLAPADPVRVTLGDLSS